MRGAVEIAGFVAAGPSAAVSESQPKVINVGRYEVALFRTGDGVVAFENVCPHQGGPIGEGVVEGQTVTCPWHGWCFDLRTGLLTLGDFARLRRFGVRIEDGMLYVSQQPQSES